ncbi:MAG: Tex family protein [Desulfuromonadales bacterium]
MVEETQLKPFQVENTIEMFREGATVPFIARYRKERTGELDEVQIRLVEERFQYFTELVERKETIVKSIDEQGKLTDELRRRIAECRLKTELEDIYLPFKPKRRTKATIARKRGLAPLADLLVEPPSQPPALEGLARGFVDPQKDVPDEQAALKGAGHILAERLSEDAEARTLVRQLTREKGQFVSKVASDHVGTVSKYELYYDSREPLGRIPSHRMLAMRRGEKEEVLRLGIAAPQEEILSGLKHRLIDGESPWRDFLEQVAVDAYRRLIAPSIEVELRLETKKRADEAAIKVFADNLRDLLLAAPAGGKRVLGVDPGLRTGSKLAVVDATGRFLEHATIYPHTGAAKVAAAGKDLVRLVEKFNVEMVAIGNGTAGREVEQFVRETLAAEGLEASVVMVSEAGASIYSASEIAREEFPDLDLTVRGAISIARRLQDPLAELVKLDPKSIGVGQYQHDVNQPALKKALDEVVESCVNYVGVDLNTASRALLSYVSGLGESLARAIVAHRDRNGSFETRQALLGVTRFGAKAFELSAGFLRIRNGSHPLDNTAVHPERYRIVEKMAADLGITLPDIYRDAKILDDIDLKRYVDDNVGLPTLRDISAELKKPGRDPRAAFRTAAYREDVREISDLVEGMLLQGTVTNVTAFGAFVDIGVHQDGLVHISELSDRFVKDPHEVIRAGDIVKVKVLSIDLKRRRIALSMKTASGDGQKTRKAKSGKGSSEENGGDIGKRLKQAGFRVKGK